MADTRARSRALCAVLWFIVASLLVLVVIGSLVIRRQRAAPRFLAGVEPGFFFEVRDEVRLCCSTARELSSRGDAWLMIEGTVDGLDLDGIETQPEPPEGLSHHTIWSWPREQTVSVRLRPETIAMVCDHLLLNVGNQATHVQMAHQGRLVFGAYDSFELAWASDDLLAVVRQLEGEGAIANLKRSPEE
ncbi:MAG TPA: hypothetical protein VGR26_11230 [Acidimicrobiales bacterium]|nr:hypothetical protein [Acidimicrobiales bacterium]